MLEHNESLKTTVDADHAKLTNLQAALTSEEEGLRRLEGQLRSKDLELQMRAKELEHEAVLKEQVRCRRCAQIDCSFTFVTAP